MKEIIKIVMDNINRENLQLQLFIAKELKYYDDISYDWTLTSRLGEILHTAEQRFGDRDKEYTILGIEFANVEQPYIWYPGSRKHIAIRLTESTLYNKFQAIYQLAHEAIHLLSPTGGSNANVLEEGLATYFAGWYLKEKLEQLNWKPNNTKYQNAMDLTNILLNMDKDNNLIKQVRAIEPTISNLKPKHFLQINNDIPMDLLLNLCTKFNQ